MIVELSGLAGVGKLTIGRALAPMIGARLLDNHTIYNPAFATTEFRSPEFYDTVRAIRAIAFDRAAALPPGVPIILTIAPGTNLAWGEEWQRAIRALTDRREARLYAVHLTCAEDEHRRRLGSRDRELLRKATDIGALDLTQERPTLLDHADAVLELDTGTLEPEAAARATADWLGTLATGAT